MSCLTRLTNVCYEFGPKLKNSINNSVYKVIKVRSQLLDGKELERILNEEASRLNDQYDLEQVLSVPNQGI